MSRDGEHYDVEIRIRCGAGDLPVVGALIFGGGAYFATERGNPALAPFAEHLSDDLMTEAVDRLDLDVDGLGFEGEAAEEIGPYLAAMQLLDEVDVSRGSLPEDRFTVEVQDVEAPSR